MFYLRSVSKNDEILWGQIWVTVFRAIGDYFAGHGGSRQTSSNNIKLACVHCNLLPAWRISGGELQFLRQFLDDANNNSADDTDSAERLASFIQDRVLSVGFLRLA